MNALSKFDQNKILNWKLEYADKAYKTQTKKNDGCGINCGHSKDFWQEFKKSQFGDVIYCDRCGQFFARIKTLPWILANFSCKQDRSKEKEPRCGYSTNHLTDSWACPVEARITDQ